MEELVLFGSRAIGSFKEASDIDIAVKGTKVNHKTADDLEFDLEEESDLPFFFDFISYSHINNEDLKRHIDKYGVVIYRKGWRKVKLGKIAEISKKLWKAGDREMPYIGLEHINKNSLRIKSIGSSNTVTSNKYIFDAGDTLFGKLRPYFRKVAQPKFNGVCSTDIWVVKPKNGTDKNFIFYFFANQKLIDTSYSSSGGTRMPRADWKFLSKTIWLIPPLSEQKSHCRNAVRS